MFYEKKKSQGLFQKHIRNSDEIRSSMENLLSLVVFCCARFNKFNAM